MIELSHRFDRLEHLKIASPLKEPLGEWLAIQLLWTRMDLVLFDNIADKISQSLWKPGGS